jgi:hypothetical protein
MSGPNMRYELLEELVRVAVKCRSMVTGSSPEAMRFQVLVEALSRTARAEDDNKTVRLLDAIGRGPNNGRESLYWEAAALIPV